MQRAVAALSRALLTAAQSTSSQWLPAATIAAQEATSSGRAASHLFSQNKRDFTSSLASWADKAATIGTTVPEKRDGLTHLLDKDVYDEAWAYEPRFGTPEAPIVVPSVDTERIIGCTDPHDDTLVIWGIIREGEPPRQLVEGGEFFVLQKVEKITRVGDLIKA